MVEANEDGGSQPLSAVVNVRLTEAECRELREAAQAAGLTLSALVRRRALGRKIVVDDRITVVRELRSLAVALDRFPPQPDTGSDAVPLLLRRIGAAIDKVA